MTFSFEDASAATRAQVSKSRAHLAGLHVWIYRDARALAASAPHKATSSSEASEAAVSVPVIVCFHGRLETCQDVKMDALLTRVAAATGAVCVTFDNPNHGSRLVDVARNHAWDRGNLHHCVDMYSQMLGAVQDMNLVLELLPGTLGIPAGWSKVGVVGISQGGHTALLAASVLPRVDVVVGLIASGDYRTNMELRHQRMSRRYQQQQQQEQQQQLQDKSDGSATSASSEVRTKPTIPNPLPLTEYYPPTLEQCVGKYDPINNTSRIAEAGPLMLLINGKEDRLVPKECNERFEAKLRPEYERRGIGHKLVRRVIDGVRHDVTESMLQQTLECLAQEFPSGTSQVTSNVHPSNSSL